MSNSEMFSRNYGYIDNDIQKKISEVKILIAGCGLGSYIAEALVRLGCSNFILVDHDTIDVHNLNRQNYIYTDIGHFKSERLKIRMQLINPEIQVECIIEPVSEENAQKLVGSADIIIDTIDFLSVKGLVALYQQCYLQSKPVISSLSAGWGAIAFYIPASNQTKNWFKEIFNISCVDNAEPMEYAYYFKQLIYRIKPHLPDEVSTNLINVFDLMAENKPCPASQLSAGSFAAASLCTTILYRVLANKEIVALPYAMGLDMNMVTLNSAFPLS
ncbi:ThiF family adenylyltransferase [Fluoribacter gormanii]|uniref:Sulfur carrier protein ThiS adenylyltransferase n=1 Tax=Fluoribacter gormanii TaxID=464 RepID=A0A377GIS9_9GAMM|nr:ThiF family adenylyltransferase [Fluoribacter gormanii]KTD00370.1 putative molybdenum cofactor synthesis protein 3 [Fluoribacter gormanii]SIQ93087.1 ThiF family protein [Fluoribacter gormanii]STO24749.1 Sulfur carrier protein ThiS adenylyltransferase [Fluoribacter gormanii]